MTYHRTITASKDGSEPAAKNIDVRNAHRVDPAMKEEKAVSREPVLDGVARDARCQELLARHHPMLA